MMQKMVVIRGKKLRLGNIFKVTLMSVRVQIRNPRCVPEPVVAENDRPFSHSFPPRTRGVQRDFDHCGTVRNLHDVGQASLLLHSLVHWDLGRSRCMSTV